MSKEILTILAGITQNDELYFLEIEPKSASHDYFAMSGFTVKPILLEEAKKEVIEGLEDGDLWKQAVEGGYTKLGLSDWINYVINTDGELSGFDNSLFNEEVEVDGQEYIFRSEACGQHEEENLKHYLIPRKSFDELMKLWRENHMKKVDVILPELPKQNITELAIEAINLINQSN